MKRLGQWLKLSTAVWPTGDSKVLTCFRLTFRPSCVAFSSALTVKLSGSSLSLICDSLSKDSSFFRINDSTWCSVVPLLCKGLTQKPLTFAPFSAPMLIYKNVFSNARSIHLKRSFLLKNNKHLKQNTNHHNLWHKIPTVPAHISGVWHGGALFNVRGQRAA